MKDEDKDRLDNIKDDLENFQEDWDDLQENEDLEKDLETLRRFADDINQLNEDAEEAGEVFEFEQEAQNIQHLLNTPFWGNVTLVYAANTFDEKNPKSSLFYDLVDEFLKHPSNTSSFLVLLKGY